MAARIMVVDDTPSLLELYCDILDDEGYEVAAYSEHVDDLSEIERVNPDLIILDYMIGGVGTGWDLLQKIRHNPATAAIPIALCTAAATEMRRMEPQLRSQGVQLILKPFDVAHLLEVIEESLRQAAGDHATPR